MQTAPAQPPGALARAMALGVQPKLAAVSTPDHPDEREADRVATEITGRSAPPATPGIDSPAGATGVPAIGGGTSLPADQRAHFGARLGQDLAHVRIHTDSGADASARMLGALAFTRGNDIAFRRGAYAPGLPSGQHLLAHELAHVVQARSRSSGGPSIFRVPAAPIAVARRDRDHLFGNAGLGVVGLTLAQFQDYTEKQSDWFAHSTLVAADRDFLWRMLLLVQANHIRSGIGDIQLADLRGLAAADWPKLETFCRGTHAAQHTVRIFAPYPPLAGRITLGATLQRLEAIIPANQLEITVSQSQLQALQADPALLPLLADYWARFEPFLEETFAPAPGGAGPEFARVLAFLNSIKAGGLAPLMALQGMSAADRWVRNLHRFPLAMLNQLVANLGETGGRRPLVLVLHTGHDAPAAFQGASGLFADLVANTGRRTWPFGIVTGPDNLVLMIEGARTLPEITARIPTIAATYGQHVSGVRRISQVVIAGHGSPKSVSLAGFSAPTVSGGGVRYTEASIVSGDPAGQALLDALMKHLDPATARVLYVGCLVGARRVAPGTAAAAIPAAVMADQSLAAWTETRATAAGLPVTPGVTVQGARASVGIGAATSLKDPSGKLAPTYPMDPAAFGSAAGYVPTGAEPEGVLRAAVEVAATSGIVVAEMMLRTRIGLPAKPGDWYDTITRLMVTIVLPPVVGAGVDIHRLNEAANLAEVPFLVLWPRFGWINAAKYVTDLNPQPFAADVYAGLAATTHYTAPADAADKRLRVVVDQGRYRFTGAAPILFAGLAAANLTADLLAPHLDITAIVLGGREAVLLPLLPGPTVHQIRLAVAWYQLDQAKTNLHVRSFLRTQVVAVPGVPPAFSAAVSGEISAAGLDVRTILTDLGFPVTAMAAPIGGVTRPVANVRVPGDPRNTVFVKPAPRLTTVKAGTLNVRASPNGTRLGTLKSGDSVDVAGTAGSWSAIDWNGRLGFVWTAFLNP